jgi:hypothetical protein
VSVLAVQADRRSALAALLLPGALALLATRCTSTPAPAAPTQGATAPDASTSSWTIPEIPLAAPRAVVLFQPPPVGPDASAIAPIPPDPRPIVERAQWVYDLRYSRGEVLLSGVHAVTLGVPRETPRVMGRFALELYEGHALLERVRFDFPGLGVAEKPVPDGGRSPLRGSLLSFNAKLSSRVGVMLPAVSRGTKLELWDRATNRRWPLPWPAAEMTADPADAGVESAEPQQGLLGETRESLPLAVTSNIP